MSTDAEMSVSIIVIPHNSSDCANAGVRRQAWTKQPNEYIMIGLSQSTADVTRREFYDA